MKARRGKAWATGLLLALLFCSLAAWAQTTAPAKSNPGSAVRTTQAEMVYHGNVRSRKFHRPSCRYYDCKNCTARFTSREQAIQAGYVPCKVCKP
ncbi:MAG: Ada metal-binding domain-containing protein [Proteobacteria bacterium]|nr:Ada metal-binding domain-containing protein [Pseudomonadota bacterium]